jgi:L-2,4-diaminobutyrate decarboxylase
MFVTPDPRTHADLRHASAAMTEAVIRALAAPGSRSPLDPSDLAAAVARIDPLPEEGAALDAVLDELAPVLEGGIRLGDPYCVAHLHPAPLIEAAVAELAVGVTNQSMDAFDASPAATFVEDALVSRLAALHGFPVGRA